MATVCQQEVTSFISFWVAFWSSGFCTAHDDGLQIVGQYVAIRRVTVPGFESQHLAHFFLDKVLCESNTWIKALHVPYLEHQTRFPHLRL